MSEEKYYHVENLKKKDKHAVHFMDWMLAVVLTKVETEYLEGWAEQSALEQMQTEERMRALFDVWDVYTSDRENYIKHAIDEGRCVENLEEYEDEMTEDWHDVLMDNQ